MSARAKTPRRGESWVHRKSRRRVRIHRVNQRSIVFHAYRAAGAVRITYKTSHAYFHATYQPA